MALATHMKPRAQSHSHTQPQTATHTQTRTNIAVGLQIDVARRHPGLSRGLHEPWNVPGTLARQLMASASRDTQRRRLEGETAAAAKRGVDVADKGKAVGSRRGAAHWVVAL